MAQKRDFLTRIDSTSAILIATKAGLKSGIGPIRAYLYDKDSTAPYWRVRVTHKQTKDGAEGQVFRIHAITGEILENAIWQSMWDHSIPVKPKD